MRILTQHPSYRIFTSSYRSYSAGSLDDAAESCKLVVSNFILFEGVATTFELASCDERYRAPLRETSMEPRTLGDRLDGYKTYLAAIGFAVLGCYRVVDRRWEGGAEMFLVALATASLRHAIARKPAAPSNHFLEDHD